MAKRKPIPIPFRVRWQEFRVQAIPFVVCGAAVFGVITLWDEQTAPGEVVGEVEAVVSQISAPQPGSLAQLFVRRFDEVEAGQVVGQVVVTPPDVLHSSLSILKAEIELTRLGWIDPVLDQQRNLLQAENLRIDWLSRRAELAIRQIELQQAEREYERQARLVDRGTVSVEAYEQARSQREVLAQSVTEERLLVAELEAAYKRVAGQRAEDSDLSQAIAATLNLHQERLRLKEAELRPIQLMAPMSGTVSAVHRHSGEYVSQGEAVVTIRSSRAEHIVAYIRQPLPIEPAVGMAVEVRSRNAGKTVGLGNILSIGSQMEPLTPVYQRPFFDAYESGLPILVSLPPELDVRPGELVDLKLVRQ
jgi:multidrug resistance efflux pump